MKAQTTRTVEPDVADAADKAHRAAKRQTADDRAARPLPEAGHTDPRPDAGAERSGPEHPATGIASHGSATSRKI